MIRIVLVGVGSFVGGVLRYGLSTWVHRVLDNPWFPYGTLAVNALGCPVSYTHLTLSTILRV